MKTFLLAALAALTIQAQTISPPPPSGGTVTSVTAGCGLTGGPITTTGTISQTVATAAHNGSYAILTGDCGKSLTTNTAAAWTIAQAGTAGFEAGKFWVVNNVGAGSLTVTATTSTFYGGPSANISGSVLTVPTLTSATIISDGTNYQVLAGGGGAASSRDYLFRVGCQGSNAAAAASWPVSNGQVSGSYVPVCDSAGGSVDGYLPLTTQDTTVLWFGPIYLDAAFVDPIPAVLQWMTTATTGTFIPTLASQCVSSGGLVSASGWGTPVSFASSTANGTTSHVTFTSALSFTTGCVTGQNLYLQLAWPISGGGTVASANVKVLDVQVK